MYFSLIAVVLVAFMSVGTRAQTEDDAIAWAATYNNQAEIVWFQAVDAEWEYNTNLTDYNLERTVSELEHYTIIDATRFTEAL